MSLTARAKQTIPSPVWAALKFGKHQAVRALQKSLALTGLNAAQRSDYYSPLPVLDELAATESLWNKPGNMAGVKYDLAAMEEFLGHLSENHFREIPSLPPYETARQAGFGPGFPYVDAIVLYALLREIKPRRYLEVGSGLSTYFCNLAAKRNHAEAAAMEIECIEPFPYPQLHSIPGIRLHEQKVQEVDLSVFRQLQDGDVLFIDSSHALKIGSDVAFLLLEVMPVLSPGVWIHIHDIHFPYNIPYPPRFWIFERNWPIYWNEAMAVQAFLAFNQAFEIRLSLPMLRHFQEDTLERLIPAYPKGLQDDHAFSSLWLRRVSEAPKSFL